MNAAVPRDVTLPHLAAALDATTMAGVFADALRACGTNVEACRIERVKYRPRRNCTLLYQLRLRDARGAYEQRVAARLCGNGDSARRAAKAATRPWSASAAGPAVLHVAALDMLTAWWPNDLRLDPARVCADDALLRNAVLPQVLAALSDGAGRLAAHRLDIAQYVPESRVCARAWLRWHRGTAWHESVLYAKGDRETNGATTHAVMRALEASQAWRSGRLRTPRSLLWQPEFGLHWQVALPGRALLDVQSQAGSAASMEVGLRLAALHVAPAPVARTHTAADLARRPHEVAAVLREVEPAWTPALQRLASALERGAGALAQHAPATLHGDLHPRNVLLDAEQRVSFIDLDGARRGPAVLDLGAWIAETLYRALLEGDASGHAAASWQAFLAGYVAGGGAQVAEPVLAWATAYQLCQRAWRCVANLKPGRYAITPQLITLAETIMRAGTPQAGEFGGATGHGWRQVVAA